MEKYNNNIDGTIDIQEQMAKNKKSAKKKRQIWQQKYQY